MPTRVSAAPEKTFCAIEPSRRMLQDLQQMLENLQMARPGQQMDGDGDDDMPRSTSSAT
jgi:hypothetical protein